MDTVKADKLRARIRANREARTSPGVLANEFAASRGWRISKPFCPEKLFAREGTTRDRRPLGGECFDYFTDERLPCAIVAHGSYNEIELARQYAQRHSLRVENIGSWRRPGYCAVLIQRPLWTWSRIN